MSVNYSYNDNFNRSLVNDEPVSLTKSEVHLAFEEDHTLLQSPYQEIPVSSQKGTPRRTRRTVFKCLFPILVLLIVAAAVVVTMMTIAPTNKKSSHPVADLPDPPIDLASTCSFDSIQDSDGRTACESQCQVADCCNYPTNLAQSCLTTNHDRCLQYFSFCSILRTDGNKATDGTTSTNTIDLSDIDTLCDPSNIDNAAGLSACRAACEIAACCFETDGTVESCSNNPDCMHYQACFFLDDVHTSDSSTGTGTSDTNLTTIVNTTCSDENLATDNGRIVCESLCSQAMCCFMSDPPDCPHLSNSSNNNHDESYNSNVKDYCARYAKCADLGN